MRGRGASRIEGFREAADTMATLSRAVQRGVGRTVVTGAARILLAEWQARAPKLTGLLIDSISVGNNRLTKKAAREARTRPGAVEVAVIASDVAAVPTEFGRKGQEPEPWARPGIDAKREELMQYGADHIKKAVDAAVQRAARRAR